MSHPAASSPVPASGRTAWLAAGALGCMLLGNLLQPAGALQGPGSAPQQPSQAQPILKYAELVFSRPGFRESLSDAEQEMRLA